jgi:superfamily II DNA or RNA helicase
LSSGLTIESQWRERKKSGEWGPLKSANFVPPDVVLSAGEDRPLLRLLEAVASPYSMSELPGGYGGSSFPNRVHLNGPLADLVMPLVCATGRCLVRDRRSQGPGTPLAWDDGPPWRMCLSIRRTDEGAAIVDFSLRRPGDVLAPRDILVASSNGHVVTSSHVTRFEAGGGFGWVSLLRSNGPLAVPAAEVDDLLAEIAARPGSYDVEVDSEFGVGIERRAAPRPRARLERTEWRRRSVVRAEVVFEYESGTVAAAEPGDRVFFRETRRLLARDRTFESAALEDLRGAGFRLARDFSTDRLEWQLPEPKLAAAVSALLARGWIVEGEGFRYRRASGSRVSVRSGIDWFAMEGELAFGDASASLAAVIEAAGRGQTFVRLDDGSLGLLPDEWLARHAGWARLGESRNGAIQFTRSQVGIVDALAASLPAVDLDEPFARARQELQSFEGITPADPAAAFHGELRAYQREGLGWIRFLERFGFGGCLADDMGLGKTVQVLAALAGRRSADPSRPPSLVVVPRSLVFNWLREAHRFVPDLRVIDHSGTGRAREDISFDADLVVTTYGTLRRDAPALAGVEFDCVVLDEAHAIKNVDSQTAKAVRLLRGRHRLALTGTPVQNHLGELWSLFEFLNPGMLGRSATFAKALANADPAQLARAVRPFVLRRTKDQVARDLPARTEDTIVCRLGRDERVFYDALRLKYQQSLTRTIETRGWAQSQLQVLEALLRLRQAACHPGLVDPARREARSAKLDVLLGHLQEAREEGHKAIVFSQFVSLLQLLRDELDREGVVYEYLDGKTIDRETRVDRFQNDPGCPLFLVSLKAGGVGLNLTAAEYVFLLDPWWNPAVEAQAIDRTHRIGQTKAVFAYRLIAENTIEEKVLELQARKRALAEAILSEDAGGLRQLTREDLELLLS